ncbi:hypothetical protein PVL29_022847 [Vitis rotundifolia]|uniref:Uncharacterized protein n=1 Tax=Vitis rotundifolia TaxID=103349 RepID=A0AA39DBW1_VITRO|nr:hypothetical protein PVL29_022847 [Vitis rotundifolia]
MKPHLQRFQHCGIENGFNEIPWLGGFNRVNDSDPYLETVGVVGSHLTKFRAESHDAADKNAWGSIDQQPCRVGSYCSKTGVRKLMHEWLGDDRMSQKIKPEISDRLGSLILKLALNVDEFNNSVEALLEKDEMSAAFHKLILMEKCHGSWRIRFIAGLFSHSSKADEPSLSSIQHCSFRQTLYLIWRLHHVLFEYMKILDPVRDSEMLLIYPNIKIRPTFNQPWYLMRLPSGMLKKHVILFPKESCFSSGGSEFLLRGLGLLDVECLLDNPVHRDPFDPYMLDDTARDLSGLANGSHPDSSGIFGTNANYVGDNGDERVGQCNNVEKGRQLRHNNEIEIPVSGVLESGPSVTSSNQIAARMLNIYSEPSQSLTRIQRNSQMF